VSYPLSFVSFLFMFVAFFFPFSLLPPFRLLGWPEAAAEEERTESTRSC